MNKILKFIFQLKGYPITYAFNELREIQKLSQDEKVKYQSEMCWKILEFHKKNTPHYNTWLGSEDIVNWKDVPILKKSDLQVPLEKKIFKWLS